MKAAKSHYIEYALLPPPRDPLRKWVLALLVLTPFAFGAIALFLGADASWDLRNYHWYNPWAYLTDHQHLDLMPSQRQFFLNPWLDVPFYLLATHLQMKTAYFILGTVQGLNFPLLFMIAYLTLVIHDARRKTATCAVLAAMGMLGANGIAEIGTVFYDNVTSIGILLSALLVLWRLDHLLKAGPGRASLEAAMMGIPAGLMAGLKLTCVSFCVGLCLSLLILTKDARRCFRLCFFFGLGLLAGFAATYAHWGWFLYTHYGSPMFPLYNQIFRSPLLSKTNLLDYQTPHDFSLIVFPFVFMNHPFAVGEIDWQDFRLPALYALFLLLIVLHRLPSARRPVEELAQKLPARFLLLAAFIAYYIWLFTETVYRYLLPLDMLAPLLIMLCIGMLPMSRRRRFQTAAIALVILAATIQPGYWGRHRIWPHQMSDITAPALSNGPPVMILMAGAHPYAYLIPGFPADISFVRLQSHGFPSDARDGVHALIQDKIKNHRGRLMLLMPERYMEDGKHDLANFNLALSPKTCRSVTDNLSEPHLDRPNQVDNRYPAVYKLCDVIPANWKH